MAKPKTMMTLVMIIGIMGHKRFDHSLVFRHIIFSWLVLCVTEWIDDDKEEEGRGKNVNWAFNAVHFILSFCYDHFSIFMFFVSNIRIWRGFMDCLVPLIVRKMWKESNQPTIYSICISTLTHTFCKSTFGFGQFTVALLLELEMWLEC